MGSIVSAKRGRRKDVFSAEGSEVAEQDHDKTEGKGRVTLHCYLSLVAMQALVIRLHVER